MVRTKKIPKFYNTIKGKKIGQFQNGNIEYNEE